MNSVITEASTGPDIISYVMGKEGPDVHSLLGMKKNQNIQQHRRYPLNIHTHTDVHIVRHAHTYTQNRQTHTNTQRHTHKPTETHKHIYANTQRHINTQTSTHTETHASTYTWTHIQERANIHRHRRKHTQRHKHICIHTHDTGSHWRSCLSEKSFSFICFPLRFEQRGLLLKKKQIERKKRLKPGV